MEKTLHLGDAVLYKVRNGLHLASIEAATDKPNILLLGEGTEGESSHSHPNDSRPDRLAPTARTAPSP